MTASSFVSENVVEIDLHALRANYLAARDLLAPGQKVMAVVKSHAYGHGMVEISRELVGLGCEFLAVFNVEEGLRLRDVGITTPILIMKGVTVDQAPACANHDLTPALYDIDVARALHEQGIQRKRPVPAHVKVDTGLGRLGHPFDEMPDFLRELRKMNGLEVQGVMSHMSVAGANDYTTLQLGRFNRAVEMARDSGFTPTHNHAGNSGVLLSGSDGAGNWVRLGLFLYGALSVPAEECRFNGLTPVMRYASRIIHIKKLPTGESVSYNRTYITDGPKVIAAIPVGYNDGFNRLFSNSAQALVHGTRVPVVGSVCMNLTMLDVTGLPDVKVGDEVVLLGRQGDESIGADELAAKAQTISYELLCNLGNRNRRVYLNKKV